MQLLGIPDSQPCLRNADNSGLHLLEEVSKLSLQSLPGMQRFLICVFKWHHLGQRTEGRCLGEVMGRGVATGNLRYLCLLGAKKLGDGGIFGWLPGPAKPAAQGCLCRFL